MLFLPDLGEMLSCPTRIFPVPLAIWAPGVCNVQSKDAYTSDKSHDWHLALLRVSDTLFLWFLFSSTVVIHLKTPLWTYVPMNNHTVPFVIFSELWLRGHFRDKTPPCLHSMENNFVASISMEIDMKGNSAFQGGGNLSRLRAHNCDLPWLFNLNILIAYFTKWALRK